MCNTEFSRRLTEAYRRMSPDCSELERRAIMSLVYHQVTGDYASFVSYQFWWTAAVYGRPTAIAEVGPWPRL